MKSKYASFDEERAKTAAINYDKFKSEIKDDKYTFRAVSQERANDQANCDATFKSALVLFFVTDTLGKQRDVTVLVDPASYKPLDIDVQYDVPTHGGVTPNLGENTIKESSAHIITPYFTTKQSEPLIITQVELDSPLAFFPDNQTCGSERGFDLPHTCLTDLIPGKKVQCAYFIGSRTCEPIHLYTGGTSHACLDLNEIPRAPQWFDMYNTKNKTIQIQLFNVQTLQNKKPWGYESYVPVPITLGPYEKCTYGFGPVDEPLALDQTNISFSVSYAYDGRNYTAITTPMTDLYNDSATWQLVGDKWIFAQQNTLTVPEFQFASVVLLTSIIFVIVYYRAKFRTMF
jgi:hypothetical protein